MNRRASSRAAASVSKHVINVARGRVRGLPENMFDGPDDIEESDAPGEETLDGDLIGRIQNIGRRPPYPQGLPRKRERREAHVIRCEKGERADFSQRKTR